MGTQEWVLLGLVLVLPLIIAIAVTLWTLEQALKRNRKNRPDRAARRVSEPVTAAGAVIPVGAVAANGIERDAGTGTDEAAPATDEGGSGAGATATVNTGSDGGSSSD